MKRSLWPTREARAWRSLGALLLAPVVTALIGSGCFLSPYGYLTEIDTRTRSPKAEDCGGCHVEIYREFAASRHATSYTDPEFAEATANHAISNCLGCHAPESIYAQGEMQLRTLYREEGVNCVACHFDGDVLAGPAPRSALMDPHPVAAERAIYRSAELCGKCHQGTFAEWNDARQDTQNKKKTCQECHMKAVKRTLTQATDSLSTVLVSFEDEFEGRSHTFEVAAIADIEDAFEVTVVATETGASDAPRKSIDVTLTSKVPHLVPTGDFGFRRIELRLEATAADGNMVASQAEDLFKEMHNVVTNGVPRVFHLDAPAGASALRVVMTTGKREGDRVVVLERRFSL